MRTKHVIQLFLLFVMTSAMACPEAADIIEQYHYVTLRPPSTLYFPGAIVAIEVDKNGAIEVGKLKLVCGPRAAMGSAWTPVSSQTVTESLKKSSRSKWNMTGEMLSAVQANASGQQVASIEVTLKNARIINMSDTELLENLRHRSPECTKAVVARLNAGHALTIISSAIVADMDYKISFKSEQSADKRVRAKQMHDIAVTLGGGHTRLSDHSIEARGLTLGIKTDSFLMALGVPDCSGDECKMPVFSQDEDGDRSVDMRSAVTSPDSDAPLVLPGGGYIQPIADF
jgi:hypothetical protein